MNLSERKWMHVTGVSFRLLKILRNRDGNKAMDYLVKRNEPRIVASVNMSEYMIFVEIYHENISTVIQEWQQLSITGESNRT